MVGQPDYIGDCRLGAQLVNQDMGEFSYLGDIVGSAVGLSQHISELGARTCLVDRFPELDGVGVIAGLKSPLKKRSFGSQAVGKHGDHLFSQRLGFPRLPGLVVSLNNLAEKALHMLKNLVLLVELLRVGGKSSFAASHIGILHDLLDLSVVLPIKPVRTLRHSLGRLERLVILGQGDRPQHQESRSQKKSVLETYACH